MYRGMSALISCLSSFFQMTTHGGRRAGGEIGSLHLHELCEFAVGMIV